MTRFLLALSIGPVQEFIAAARRTADLYAGSQLLMEIVGAAAAEFEQPDDKRIFPVNLDGGGANKILVLVPGDPAERAEAARKRAVKCLTDNWEKLVTGQRIAQFVDTDLAKRQLAQLLEFYAAWVPFEEGSDYSERRDRVESLLAGRKALRDFEAFSQGDAGIPKSPLDPAFASVLKRGPDRRVVEALREHPWYFKASEGLDAVSLLKRLYGRERLKRLVPDTRSLAQRALEPGINIDDDDDKYVPQQPYFVILIADGDSMGAMLEARNSPGEHQTLSQRLDVFASEARRIVEKDNDGFAVFTGGDDVLALLPVTTALKCGWELSEAFRTTVRGTLSAGLAIVHYKEPLSVSRRQAERAEKSAKSVEGKAAACVALHTRGGNPVITQQKWEAVYRRPQEGTVPLDTIFEYQQAGVPRGLAYELVNLAREWPDDLDTSVMTAEAQRITDRKVKQDGEGADLQVPLLNSVEELEQLSRQFVQARFLSGRGERA